MTINIKRLCIIFLVLLIGLSLYFFFSYDTTNESNHVERLTNIDISNRPRTVVSFSTIPSRTKYIADVIAKIKKQSFQPDMIYVCVPYYSKRMKQKYIIPKNMNFGNNVRIVRGKDYGPGTKLLGCIPYENDPETAIITIDDDQDYHPDTFKTLLGYGIVYSDKVCAFRTLDRNLIGTSCPNTNNIKSPDAFYAEGFAGVLYRRKFITKEMITFCQKLSKSCFVSDDLFLSSWMEINGVERIKICEFSNCTTNKEIDKNDALHRDKRTKVYDTCSEEMKTLIYRKESRRLLDEFNCIMGKNNIPYIIICGTLLGSVRDGDFIAEDHDIDILILKEHLEKYLELKDKFKQKGLRMGYSDNIHRLQFDKDNVNSYIDVFVYEKENDKYVDISKFNRKRWPREYYFEHEIFPICQYKIGDLIVSGPNKPITILERIYGDWETTRNSSGYFPKPTNNMDIN